MTTRSLLAGALLAALSLPGAALAQDADADAFHAWGKLDAERDVALGELEYVDRSGERPKRAEAYVTWDDDTELFADRLLELASLEEGQEVWILGDPVEQTTTTEEGQTHVDRQITKAQAIVFGVAVAPRAARPDPEGQPDLRWCEATIVRSGQAPSVTYQGQEYRLVCARRYAVVERLELDELPSMRKDRYVEVVGEPADERPEEADDEDLEVHRARRLVILDKRAARSVYPLLLP